MKLSDYLEATYKYTSGEICYSEYNGYDYDRARYTRAQAETFKAISEKYPEATIEPHTSRVRVGVCEYSVTREGNIVQKKVLTFVYNIDGLGDP